MLIYQDAKNIHTVTLDDCRNSIEEFVAVARYHAKVKFTEGFQPQVARGNYCKRRWRLRR